MSIVTHGSIRSNIDTKRWLRCIRCAATAVVAASLDINVGDVCVRTDCTHFLPGGTDEHLSSPQAWKVRCGAIVRLAGDIAAFFENDEEHAAAVSLGIEISKWPLWDDSITPDRLVAYGKVEAANGCAFVKAMSHALREAFSYVDDLWPKINTVAGELYDGGTVTQERLRQLVTGGR